MTIPIVTRIGNPPFQLKTKHVSYFIGMLMVVILCLIKIFEIPLNGTLVLIFISSMIIFISLRFFAWKEYYPIKHEVSGYINLDEEGIKILDVKFKWEELEKLSIEFNDFKGKRIRNSIHGIGPFLSQGVNNYIRFIHDNKTYQYQILINSETSFLRFRGTLWRLYSNKSKNHKSNMESKISDFDKLTYAEIQRFKREHDS